MTDFGWITITIDANAVSMSEHNKLKSAYKLAIKSKGLRFRKDSDGIVPDPTIKFSSSSRYENRLTLSARIDDTQFELIDVETVLESIFEQIVAELNAVAELREVTIEVRKRIYSEGILKFRECRVSKMWGRL
jgi:hypothetical protein